MTKFNFILLLNLLPILSFGQGIILEKSFEFNHIDYSLIDDLQPITSNHKDAFIVLSDSIYIVHPNDKISPVNTLNLNTLPIDFNPYAVAEYGDIIAHFDNTKLVFYNFKKQKLEKKITLNKKYSQVIWYTFQNADFLYFISYYNNNNRAGLGHDFVYFYKISKRKKKVIKIKEINVGKEIIFAPLNRQLITFNGREFLMASSISSNLLRMDSEFNILDTISPNPKLAIVNQPIFDSIIPDSSVKRYLYYPKRVIYHYNNSVLSALKTLIKATYVNDSIVILAYQLKHHEQYQIEMYDVKNKKSLSVFDTPFRGNKYSFFCWTNRILLDQNDNFLTSHTEEINDSTLVYKIDIYSFNANTLINFSRLKGLPIYNDKMEQIDLSRHSGVVLADDYYCKSCYSSDGAGEGVLVIVKSNFSSPARLKAESATTKRNWFINGDLGFVNEETFQKLQLLLNVNVLYPME